MVDYILIAIEFIVPLTVSLLVLSLTYKHFRNALLDFTEKEAVARLFSRIFAATVVLGAIVYPLLQNSPCGTEQLLSYIGISFVILLITLFANLFVMSKLISTLSRRRNSSALSLNK